ncbi:hypothetical protein DKX38_006537 [Salix brachista]|uniref:RING-type domain-containing protein n=1 Tax=Salix brachista TaxID=2182728 RepID=A0A5N5N229_9ROSI|nr:hypothetical protein DKX38_006537 [Salix brachista]
MGLELGKWTGVIHASEPMEPDRRLANKKTVTIQAADKDQAVVLATNDDKATSWDSFEEPFDLVRQACKPPIPCLQKTKVDHNLGSKEDLFCPICVEHLLIGSEPACTTCSHLYHSHCINKWLITSTSCSLFAFRIVRLLNQGYPCLLII